MDLTLHRTMRSEDKKQSSMLMLMLMWVPHLRAGHVGFHLACSPKGNSDVIAVAEGTVDCHPLTRTEARTSRRRRFRVRPPFWSRPSFS
jgi:hypothetical protein